MEYKKGNISWNKGTKGICKPNKGSFKKGCISINKGIPRDIKTKGRIGLSNHIRKANHCNLSQEAIEWINGELLGDGCLFAESIYSARVCYTSKYEEYINYVSNILKSFGIEQSGERRKYHHTDRDMDCYYYNYQSRAYTELYPIYKQWYPERKKTTIS